jgi:hypothetical protein
VHGILFLKMHKLTKQKNSKEIGRTQMPENWEGENTNIIRKRKE